MAPPGPVDTPKVTGNPGPSRLPYASLAVKETVVDPSAVSEVFWTNNDECGPSATAAVTANDAGMDMSGNPPTFAVT